MTLERLVSDLLDVSKIEAGQLQLETRPFDLDEALAALHRASCAIGPQDKGLAFEVTRDAQARGRFLGDGARISQILGNLLSNAVKFTDEGGVASGRRPDARRRTRACLTLSVEDTGVGFDAAHADRLFDRFSQADETISRRFGGTGLGLSICRSLARDDGRRDFRRLAAGRRQPVRRHDPPAAGRAAGRLRRARRPGRAGAGCVWPSGLCGCCWPRTTRRTSAWCS